MEKEVIGDYWEHDACILLLKRNFLASYTSCILIATSCTWLCLGLINICDLPKLKSGMALALGRCVLILIFHGK